MSVYVDEMAPCIQTAKWHYEQSCHLVADCVTELHIFANQIGLSRSWFQKKPELPHYDLTYGMRVKAVAFGAIEVGNEKLVELMKKYRDRSRRIGP